MAGIGGVVGGDPTGIEPAVRRMVRAMAHRGSAGDGYVACTLRGMPGGLGFCGDGLPGAPRDAPQPLVHRRTGDLLVVDGFLSNRRSLHGRLRAQGVGMLGQSDAELALNAFVAWGEAAVEQFEGAFALAYTHAESGRVLLARDALGAKPLYVATGKSAIVFASEVRAILSSGLVADDLDPAGVATVLAYGSVQEPLTVHRAIKAVRAGTLQWLNGPDGRTTERRFWRFPDAAAPYDRATAAARLQTALDESVAGMVATDVPATVLLTGGLGSGLVAAFTRYHAQAIETASLGFESKARNDGLAEAAATAKALHAGRHRQTVVDDDWIAAQWDDWVRAADAPGVGGLDLSVLAGVVRETDAQQALVGIGATELFGGSGLYEDVRRLAWQLRPVRLIPRAARQAAAATIAAALPAERRTVIRECAPGPQRACDLAAALLRIMPTAALREIGLAAHEIGLAPDYLPDDVMEQCAPGADVFHQVSRLECLVRLVNGRLRDADVFGMAQSLELRAPFVVRPIINLAHSMTEAMKAPPKMPPGHMLRKAAGAFLPYDAIVRGRANYGLPFAEWLWDSVRDQAEAAIVAVCGCPIIEGGPVRQWWDAWQAAPTEAGAGRLMPFVALGSYLLRRRR